LGQFKKTCSQTTSLELSKKLRKDIP